MTVRVRLALGLLIAAVIEAGCERMTSTPVTPDADYEVLRNAPLFAAGPIGPMAVTSEGEAALVRILSRPNASRDLHRLMLEATVAGRLYVLWGLAALGDAEFKAPAPRCIPRGAVARVQAGCFVKDAAAWAVVAEIQKGAYGEPVVIKYQESPAPGKQIHQQR